LDFVVSFSHARTSILYAMNYNGMGELHSFPYLGQIPEEEIIPEPSTWTMLTLGVAGFVRVGWRRGLSKSGALP
jgi:hypothetical protein